MAYMDRRLNLEQTFEQIEETILPSLAMMLDTLLDAAALGEVGVDATVYAAELRTVALELEALTRRVEAISPVQPSRIARA
ncbi:MAG TPA: hypothetical protein VGW34_16080 [Allosphingosinicella sp.]|nr:hypothetical protein [Allosphingosinicella sp.]